LLAAVIVAEVSVGVIGAWSLLTRPLDLSDLLPARPAAVTGAAALSVPSHGVATVEAGPPMALAMMAPPELVGALGVTAPPPATLLTGGGAAQPDDTPSVPGRRRQPPTAPLPPGIPVVQAAPVLVDRAGDTAISGVVGARPPVTGRSGPGELAAPVALTYPTDLAYPAEGPTVSGAQESRPEATAAPPPVVVRTEPTRERLRAAKAEIDRRTHFFKPTTNQIRQGGDEVCTAFDQGYSYEEVRKAMVTAADRYPFLGVSNDDVDVFIGIGVDLFCGGHGGRLP
jgi:hypothetical protein